MELVCSLRSSYKCSERASSRHVPHTAIMPYRLENDTETAPRSCDILHFSFIPLSPNTAVAFADAVVQFTDKVLDM
jgi:hypothetical protein